VSDIKVDPGARAAVITGVLLLSTIVGLASSAAALAQAPPPQLANPASQNCAAKGGALRIESRPDGGQYGVCVFVDNYQCEEWALFRAECPAGGLRVTGYLTPAARYCAITGGRYAVVAGSGAADEQGACALPGGKACDAAAYYAGTCSR
jgi:putative hemolysin